MANPLFQAMGGKVTKSEQKNLAPGLLQYMRNFQGNPLEALQGKLNSGEMSQQQYNQLRGVAETIAQRMMGMLPRR